MKKIQNQLKAKPDSERINLSFLQIESINDIIFELFHFEKLKEIDLSCNRLTSLPKDLSILRTVERLDLSSNLFEDLPAVFSALNTMPHLKELNINYDASKSKNAISFYLPRLEVLNGEVIKAGGESLLRNPVVKITEGKVEIERNKNASSRKLIANPFLVFEDEEAALRSFLQAFTAYNKENNNNPKYSTKEFLDDCKRVEQLTKNVQNFNEGLLSGVEEGRLVKNSDCLAEKKREIKQIIDSFLKALRSANPKMVAVIEPLFRVLFMLLVNVESHGPSLRLGIGERPPELHPNASSHFSKIAQPIEQDDTDAEKTLLRLKLAELESELREIRSENDDLFNFISKHAQEKAAGFAKKMNKKYVQANGDATPKPVSPARTPPPELERSANRSRSPIGEDNPERGRAKLMAVKNYNAKRVAELIADVMKSKRSYDQRVAARQADPETLESYLYVYFKQKYGLRDLIMVEVVSVVDKIKECAAESALVDVFKHMLKSELDEKFYWYLQSVQSNLRIKLEAFFRARNKKTIPLTEVTAYLDSKMNGAISLEEAEYLLENSFPEKEVKAFRLRLRDYFDIKSEERDGKRGLRFSDYLEFVYRLETERHLASLSQVTQFFARADESKEGHITKKEFLNFMGIITSRNPKIDVQKIVEDVDPNNQNKITFSKVIEVLSSYYTDDTKKENLIQFLQAV